MRRWHESGGGIGTLGQRFLIGTGYGDKPCSTWDDQRPASSSACWQELGTRGGTLRSLAPGPGPTPCCLSLLRSCCQSVLAGCRASSQALILNSGRLLGQATIPTVVTGKMLSCFLRHEGGPSQFLGDTDCGWLKQPYSGQCAD